MTNEGSTRDLKRPKRRILIAEDAGLQIRLMQIHLEHANFEVIIATDGLEAVMRVELDIPDLVILDVEMPLLNGFQVINRIRSNDTTRHIPIIMLTAHAKDAPMFAECSDPADIFMTKPYHPTDLIERVKELLARSTSDASELSREA